VQPLTPPSIKSTRLDTRLDSFSAIGDGRHGALLDPTGTIVWYSPAGIDEPAALYSLLAGTGPAAASAGRIQLALERPDTVGTVSVTGDAPIVRTQIAGRESLLEIADHLEGARIVRVLTMLRGRDRIIPTIMGGDRYNTPRKTHRWSNGVAFGELIVAGIDPSEGAWLEAGDRLVVTIGAHDEKGFLRTGVTQGDLTVGAALAEQADLDRAWRYTVGNAEIGGPFENSARRSLRALRMLTNPATGALVRTLTTSLPARIGNERNIDERYAFVRDNAEAVRLYERIGRFDWADATRNWLHDRYADPLSPELAVAAAYRSTGEQAPSESDSMLSGWNGNGPVRFGTTSGSALDLGGVALGSMVLDAARSWSSLERVGDWLCKSWRRRDCGRWNERHQGHTHTESTLSILMALEALIASARARNVLDPAIIGWSICVSEIDAWLETEGLFGKRPTAGWRRAGGDDADDTCDASLLALVSRSAPRLSEDVQDDTSTRLIATLDQSLAQLSEGVFTHRHMPHASDGFPPGQGGDLWASFTMVSALCAAQRWELAHSRMESLISHMGPTHIGATHVDPITGDLRGNLLASPAHLALINAALDLAAGPS
jgi:Glycosyl hydrolases family 15